MTEQKLTELLRDMSLEEKVNQMSQVTGGFFSGEIVVTGPMADKGFTEDNVNLAGSVIGSMGAETLKSIQKNYMEKHPHHIPMLFMADIINGYRTVFPIPLAQGCTFDPGWRRNALLSQPVKLPLQACMSPFRPWLIWYGTPAGGVSWNLRGRILI